MEWRIDPEGVEACVIERLLDLRGLRVLELGCGDGRLTSLVASRAASVLAVDPDEEAIAAARRSLEGDLAARVRFEVASAAELEVPPTSFDLALFSWSL